MKIDNETKFPPKVMFYKFQLWILCVKCSTILIYLSLFIISCLSITMTLNLKTLLVIAQENNGYPVPSLNDILHLHFKSLHEIPPDIVEFTDLKSLYLNNNFLSQFSKTLLSMNQLSSLEIQNNSISEIQFLPPNLRKLNISENLVEKIHDDMIEVPLQNLNLSQNVLSNISEFKCIFEESDRNRWIQSLQILNLERNRIEDESIIDKIKILKELRYLKLGGNPFIKKVKEYRKRLICALPNLTFLDEYPVTVEERRLALAWERGGVEEVNKERELLREERERKVYENHMFMEELMREASNDN